MVQIGDISVDRHGNTFVYKRGNDELVKWTIDKKELSDYDDRYIDELKDKCFSIHSDNGYNVIVDMKNGIHSFRSDDYVFQVELPECSVDGNGNGHFKVYYKADTLSQTGIPVYDGGAILDSEFSWRPEGKGKLSCVINGRKGILEGTFKNGVCTGSWLYVDDNQSKRKLYGDFENIRQDWKPKRESVMKEYSGDFKYDTNSCIYVVTDQGEDGFFCKEQTFVLRGKRVNGCFNGDYTAYQPKDLQVFLGVVDVPNPQYLPSTNLTNYGLQFNVGYNNNKLIYVENYKQTMDSKERVISYHDGHRVITTDSVSYMDESSSVIDHILGVTCSFSIEGKEGYQKDGDITITGFWDSNMVKGHIDFPNGVCVRGVFDGKTKQPRGKCIFFLKDKELLQLEFKDPFVVIEWEENGYQFHGEYLLSLWSSTFSNHSPTPDSSTPNWLPFLTTIAEKGVSFPERYENAVVTCHNEEWSEMTLFRKDILCHRCEEFLENRCDDCYYSMQMLRLLRRSDCALMVLKYGRQDSKVPKWATSYFPNGSALYLDKRVSRDRKEAFFFYGMETLLNSEKEEGGMQLGSFTTYRLTRPKNQFEEQFNFVGNKKRYEEYSVCRRGFCGITDNTKGNDEKERSPFEDGRDFEVFRGEGEFVGGRFVMVKGTVRVILGEYMLSMEYEQKEKPEKEVYRLVGKRLNSNKENQIIMYEGGLEFECGIPIRCCGKGWLQDGNVKYEGFYTANVIECARLYKNAELSFCGTIAIKKMNKLYGWYKRGNKLGGEGKYWAMADDWSTVSDSLDNTDSTCPLFNHRYIYIKVKNEQDPYVLVVDANDEVQYDLKSKTVIIGNNKITYESLKTFSLPRIVD